MNFALPRRPRGILVALLLCAALASPARAQAVDAWVVREASDATMRSDSAATWVPLKVGDTVAGGASLRTGAKGRLVVARSTHNDTITAAPASEFTLPHLQSEARQPTVLETLGTLLFKVEHTPGRHFEVKTPYLTAVVKGTVFTVAIDSQENVVHLVNGSVEVTDANTNEAALLRPGQTARVPLAPGRPMQISGLLTPGSASADKVEAPSGAGQQGITRTLGDVHLDVAGLTNNLVRPAASHTAAAVDSRDTTGSRRPSTAATGSSVGPVVSSNGSSDPTGTIAGGTSGGAASSASSAASGTVSTVSGTVGGTVSTVGGTVSTVGSAVGGAVGSVGGAVGGTVSTVGGSVGGTVTAVGGTVGGTLGNVGGAVGGTVSTVGGTVGGTLGNVGGAVGGTVSGATSTVANIAAGATSAVGNIVNPPAATSAGSTAAGTIANTLNALLGSAKGKLK